MASEKLESLKALKENNMLDEKDLEEVAAGSSKELSDDSRFLNVLLRGRPEQPERKGEYMVGYTFENVSRAWESLDVNVRYLGDEANMYWLRGKRITRDQAWAHAEQVVGKHLEKSDWDW